MRDGEANVSLWLLAWHGRAEDGLAILTELGMGPEDARRALASTPALLARELSPATAREVADRLESMGGRVELRVLRPNAPVAKRTASPTAAEPTHPTPPWYRRPLYNLIAGLFLCVMLVVGLRTAGVVRGTRVSITSETNVARGIREEAMNHRNDPAVARLFDGMERDDAIAAEAVQAQFRGLQYLSHADLVEFFDLMKRGLESPTGCGSDRSLAQLAEVEQVRFGHLTAKAIALGAHPRPLTSGHERAMDEGIRFAYRQLATQEQTEFMALAERAENGEEGAACEWSVRLIQVSEGMHADLQRRFLRALAYDLAQSRGVL